MGLFSKKITANKINESLSGFFDTGYGSLVIGFKDTFKDQQISINKEQDKELITVPMFATWSQTFNATDMSTIYPYANNKTIPAAHIRRARGGEPKPRAEGNALGNSSASGSSAEHHSTRGKPQ